MDTNKTQQCMVLFKNRTYQEAFEDTLEIFNDYQLDLTECDQDKGIISGTAPINPPYENVYLSAHFFKGNNSVLVGVKGKLESINPKSKNLGKWIRKFYFELRDRTIPEQRPKKVL